MNYTVAAVVVLLGFAGAAHAGQGVLQPGQTVPRNDPNGVYCREYTQQVMIGGRGRDSYGTACQQPDGSWKVVTTDQQSSEEQVEYVSEPEYISPPRYVMPPVAYYEPYPYYAPYSSVQIGGYYGRDAYYGHGRGGYGHYRH